MLGIESWILIRRQKNNMKTRILVGLLLSLGLVSNSISQGISSQLADDQGYFGQFGKTGLNMNYLCIGADRIQTAKNVVVLPGGSIPRPTLRLNPIGGKVTIGGGITDPAGTLTILSHLDNNAARDIHFKNQGNIGSDGSIYVVLDQDNNGDDFFSVKGSEFDDDLFWVGENGRAYLKGDLVVDGKITSKSSDILTIGFLDVEVFNESGDELYTELEGYVYGYSDYLVPGAFPTLGAAVNLPHRARITKIEVIFKDNNPEEWFGVYFISLSDVSDSKRTLYRQSSTAEFADPNWQKWSQDLDVPVDNANRLYYVDFSSSDWGEEIFLRQVKIYYDH